MPRLCFKFPCQVFQCAKSQEDIQERVDAWTTLYDATLDGLVNPL